MPMKKYKPEQIVTLLRQVEVEIANGKTTPQACKEAEITAQTLLPLAEGIRRIKAGSSQTSQGAGAGERQAEAAGGGAVFGEANSEGCGRGKLLSPERRRGAVRHARENYRVSERHACRLLGQWRGTQRYEGIYRTDEDALTRDDHGAGQRIRALRLPADHGDVAGSGWHVGKDRVQRIWRREGLKVPQKQRPRGRLWLNDGSCVRLRPERANHVWSYDFVSAMTHDGRTLRMLTLIDEYTRECLAIRVARRLGRYEVIEALADVMLYRGIPETHSLGQRPGVRGRGTAEVAGEGGHRDAVHRTGKSLGERLLRKLQREAARRMPERGDFLFAEGGAGGDREMAGGVQHDATALGAGLQAAGAGGVRAANGGSPVAYGSLRAAICTLAR